MLRTIFQKPITQFNHEKKHQTNPQLGTFYKILTLTLQNYQGHQKMSLETAIVQRHLSIQDGQMKRGIPE